MKATDYQNEIVELLQNIFGKDLVRKEWDSVEYDSHFNNHKNVYAPRLDVAVGPFNFYPNLDVGTDNSLKMVKHAFTKKLREQFLDDREKLENIWNRFGRCYLAIEIEFNSNSKHAFGSLINASVSGALAIVVVNTEKKKKELERLINYVLRLQDFDLIELNSLRNLVVFEKSEFVEFLKTII